MSHTFKLFRLQQIDSQLDQVRSRLNNIEASLNNDTLLQQAKAELTTIETKLHETRKTLHRIEEEVYIQVEKNKQTEISLYSGKIQNPKELQDLQKESIALKKQLSVLEDRQLEWMLALEDVETELQKSTATMQTTLSKVATQNASLVGEQTTLLNEYKRHLNGREVIASTIDLPDLDLYEQLRQQRKGVAVAVIIDQSCSGCGSGLTPALAQAARNPRQIIRCSFCGRILYGG